LSDASNQQQQQSTKDQENFNKKNHNQAPFNISDAIIFKKPTSQATTYSSNSTLNATQMLNNFNYNKNQQYKMITPPFQPYFNAHNKHQNVKNNHQQNHQSSKPMNGANNHNSNNNNNKDKYNRRYNLISFLLLRKNDDFSTDRNNLLHDQVYYEKIDHYIEKMNLDGLRTYFIENPNLISFVNVYNCSLLVYTIRKCFECIKYYRQSEFVKQLFDFLFDKQRRPANFYFLIDGDYPKRNLLHYAARYDSIHLMKLILNALKEDYSELEQKNQKHEDENTEISLKKLDEIFVQLCIQLDFNLNTPVHLCAQFNSLDVLKFILKNPLCIDNPFLIEQTMFLFNEDGLNPFLLACRHSDINLVKFLIDLYSELNKPEEAKVDLTNIILLHSLDLTNYKNCLHYALSQDSSRSYTIVNYLINLAIKKTNTHVLNELVGSFSKLVGSIFHIAASNSTRLSTLWFLLNLDVKEKNLILTDKLEDHDNLEESSIIDYKSLLDSHDFREFSTVDCLIDSLMNLREMAPANYKCLQNFYNSILKGN
jgi:hypothetical protein